MKTITGLKVQTKDKNRVNVSLDGSYFCALMLECVVKHNLKVGMMIDEKVLENLQLESEKTFAYEKALKLVSTRYKTKKEVENYLHEKGYAPATIWFVIKKLSDYDFINDERYVDSYLSHYLKKDGVRKIKQKLLAKGISEELIDGAINNVDEQLEQIIVLKDKYMKNKDDTKENYLKLYRYLVGKGFRTDEIMKVLKGEVEWLVVM